MLSPQHQECLKNLIALNDAGKLEGEFKDIPIEVYHHPLCPGFSKSLLMKATTYNRLLAYTAKRVQEANDPNHVETKSYELMMGSAVDEILFDPDNFEKRYARGLVIPSFGDKRVKANKEKYEEWTRLHHGPWLEQNKGKIELKPEEWLQVLTMGKSARDAKQFALVMDGGEVQISYWYRHATTGTLMKCRPDVINKKKRLVYDHKTTVDASVEAFKRTAKNFGYGPQLAMQIDGANAILGGVPFMGLWGVQDRDEPPHDLAFYTPDDPSLDQARNWIHDKLTYLAEAKAGSAPKGYPDGITPIGITGWVLT